MYTSTHLDDLGVMAGEVGSDPPGLLMNDPGEGARSIPSSSLLLSMLTCVCFSTSPPVDFLLAEELKSGKL